MKKMIKILFICHGNICRSPMAEYVLKDMVERAGLADRFVIDSAATSTEEIGNGVHHGTRSKLREEGIPCGNHRARQIRRKDYEEYDYLIGMDEWNIRSMRRMLGGDPEHKICKMLSFGGSGRDVADPWYTGDFDATYEDIEAGCKGLLNQIRRERRI